MQVLILGDSLQFHVETVLWYDCAPKEDVGLYVRQGIGEAFDDLVFDNMQLPIEWSLRELM